MVDSGSEVTVMRTLFARLRVCHLAAAQWKGSLSGY
jgi:hypothetical protein